MPPTQTKPAPWQVALTIYTAMLRFRLYVIIAMAAGLFAIRQSWAFVVQFVGWFFIFCMGSIFLAIALVPFMASALTKVQDLPLRRQVYALARVEAVPTFCISVALVWGDAIVWLDGILLWVGLVATSVFAWPYIRHLHARGKLDIDTMLPDREGDYRGRPRRPGIWR